MQSSTTVHWSHSLTKSRYIWDCVLFISFILVMSPRATTIAGHEWLSVLFVVPFCIHLLLHWQWVKQTGSRLFRKTGRTNHGHFALDVLLYSTMTFAFISGFLASEAIFVQLGLDFKPDRFWTVVHHQYSNLLFPLVGIHIAVHWGWVVKNTRRMLAGGAS